MANRDTVSRTVLVAFLLCLGCSLVVSYTAVSLRPLQEINQQIERKIKILSAAGLYSEGVDIDAMFARFEPKVVDLQRGTFSEGYDPLTLDTQQFQRDSENSIRLTSDQDIATIRQRENFSVVYLLRDDNQAIQTVVLPVRGYGLWGILHGYLALDSDLQSVVGLEFYDHKETPGLGGEVDNPRWKQLWRGKKIYNNSGDYALKVIKGQVDARSAQAVNQVDGLAGATLTSRGVSRLLRFWLGEDGFGPWLDNLNALNASEGSR